MLSPQWSAPSLPCAETSFGSWDEPYNCPVTTGEALNGRVQVAVVHWLKSMGVIFTCFLSNGWKWIRILWTGWWSTSFVFFTRRLCFSRSKCVHGTFLCSFAFFLFGFVFFLIWHFVLFVCLHSFLPSFFLSSFFPSFLSFLFTLGYIDL